MPHLLDECELVTLRTMSLYWLEVAQRGDPESQRHIATDELGQVIHLLGAEKVLHIIAEYVEDQG